LLTFLTRTEADFLRILTRASFFFSFFFGVFFAARPVTAIFSCTYVVPVMVRGDSTQNFAGLRFNQCFWFRETLEAVLTVGFLHKATIFIVLVVQCVSTLSVRRFSVSRR
jgi:hypothetical protein